MSIIAHSQIGTDSDSSSQGSPLIVSLTTDPYYLEQAQKLRYSVFFDEAPHEIPEQQDGANLLDYDEFDSLCDHLLVIDKRLPEGKNVVGTYRLRRIPDSESFKGLYTQSEFDMSCLIESKRKNFLELGRSCIHPDYRKNSVIQLLWKGIGQYVAQHDISVLFGCASFAGTDPQEHILALSYLYHYHRAEDDIGPVPLPHAKVDFTPIPLDCLQDKRRIFSLLPPLIKGYIRLGASVSDGFVVDHECKTIDTCILLDRNKISTRYYNHFVGEPKTIPTNVMAETL